MAFIDDMQERDLALLQALDGRDILYSHQGHTLSLIKGMFQNFSELTGGETVDVVVSSPVLTVRSVDVPRATCGDFVLVDDITYEVVVVRPDNEGMIELILQELG